MKYACLWFSWAYQNDERIMMEPEKISANMEQLPVTSEWDKIQYLC